MELKEVLFKSVMVGTITTIVATVCFTLGPFTSREQRNQNGKQRIER